jgi:hypothetical protein
MSDKLQLVVKAGNTYLAQTEIPTFLHPKKSLLSSLADKLKHVEHSAAAYTVRARPGALVSAPCTWGEVERGEVAPRSFTIRNMAQRIEDVGDLWSELLKAKRSLRLPMERLEKMS